MGQDFCILTEDRPGSRRELSGQARQALTQVLWGLPVQIAPSPLLALPPLYPPSLPPPRVNRTCPLSPRGC